VQHDRLKVWQPFRENINKVSSNACKGIVYHYAEPFISIDSSFPYQCISNAVWNGGFVASAHYFMNYRVPLSYESNDPFQEYKELITARQYKLEHTVGLMTAAKLSHATIAEYASEKFAMSVIVTAGTSNAARAGVKRDTYAGYHGGTINIFLFIDGKLTQSAMLNAYMTATEAKCAALADLHIVEQSNGLIATGTTTDALVVAVSQQASYENEYLYAGTATDLGCKLAELVYCAIYTCVSTQKQA